VGEPAPLTIAHLKDRGLEGLFVICTNDKSLGERGPSLNIRAAHNFKVAFAGEGLAFIRSAKLGVWSASCKAHKFPALRTIRMIIGTKTADLGAQLN
jgi:hypothetical protein